MPIFAEVAIVADAKIFHEIVEHFVVLQNTDQLQNVHLGRVNQDIISVTWERIYGQIRDLQPINQE